MGEQQNNTPPAGDGGTPPAGAPPAAPAGDSRSERTYTEADLQAARQAAHDSAWGQARRHFEKRTASPEPQRPSQPPAQPPAAPPPAQGATQDSSAELLAEVRQLRAERAFDELMPDGVTLEKAQRKLLRDMYVQQQPTDGETWIGGILDTFKLRTTQPPEGSGTAAAGNGRPPAAPAASQGPPRSDSGSPAAPREFSRLNSPMEFTGEDYATLVEKHGKRQANRMVAARVQQHIRGR